MGAGGAVAHATSVRVEPGECSCGSAVLTSTLPGLPVAEQEGFQVASCGPAEVHLAWLTGVCKDRGCWVSA